MNILYLSSAGSIHTIRWANAMAARGHKIHLVTMHPLDKFNSIDGSIRIYKLPFRPPGGYFLNKWHFKKILKDIKPDLLHAHYASGYGTLARLSGFHPELLSVWGSDILLFPEEAGWKKKILLKNLNAADHITSTSNFMASQIEKYSALKNIAVIPFGVDCEKFKPISTGKSDNIITVGTVKTLEAVYGIEYLLKAFALLKNRYKGKKSLRLLIAGSGPLKKKLVNLSADLEISKETEFLERSKHSDVPGILNRISIFANLSESESFGVSVIEASACGVPVIVSDAGGLTEVVKDKETGFVVPRRDPESAAQAMLRLVENDNLRVEMGASGRNFVMKNYEWNKNVSKMEEVYSRIKKESA